MKVKVQILDSRSFAPYGEVLGPQTSKPAISEPVIDFWPGVSDIKPSYRCSTDALAGNKTAKAFCQ